MTSPPLCFQALKPFSRSEHSINTSSSTSSIASVLMKGSGLNLLLMLFCDSILMRTLLTGGVGMSVPIMGGGPLFQTMTISLMEGHTP